MGFNSAFKGLNLLGTNFFQQDGARFHYALTLILLTWSIGWAPNNASRWQMGFNMVFKGLNVRRLFNDVFTDKWIARVGPIAWPALSPNLTPLDYQYTILLLTKMSTYQLLHHKCKGKAIPLQAWTGTEGSKRFRLPDFLTIGTWMW